MSATVGAQNLAQVFQSFANSRAGTMLPAVLRGSKRGKTDEFKNLILNRISLHSVTIRSGGHRRRYSEGVACSWDQRQRGARRSSPRRFPKPPRKRARGDSASAEAELALERANPDRAAAPALRGMRTRRGAPEAAELGGGGDARALVRRSLAGPGHPRWEGGGWYTSNPPTRLDPGGLKGAMVSNC